jgi:hypothetical protein
LDWLPLFEEKFAGTSWDVEFQILGCKYNHAYYPVDGIYPSWSTLIKSKCVSQYEPSKHFQKLQEAFQKDIKRVFGFLQIQWAILVSYVYETLA